MVPEVILKTPGPIEDPDRVPEATTPVLSVNVHVQLSAIAGTRPTTKAITNIHAILFIVLLLARHLPNTNLGTVKTCSAP
jgi:hypothetical protein